MRCTRCGLLLPSTLLVMRCPHCQEVILDRDKPSQSSQRSVKKDVIGYLKTKSTRILITLCLLQLLLFSWLAWWVHLHPSWFIDVLITHALQRHLAIVGETMKFVSMLGNVPYLFRAIVCLTAILLWIFRHRLEAVSIVLFFELSMNLNSLVKVLVNRPRPTAMAVKVIEAAGGTSFPSGHVMSYMAFWGLLFVVVACVFKRKSWWQKAVLLISALFVVLIGPSRVYVGAHWATDVLGSYLLEGALICLAVILYLKVKVLLPEFPVFWKQRKAV